MNIQFQRDLLGWCICYHLERPTLAVCMLERLRVCKVKCRSPRLVLKAWRIPWNLSSDGHKGQWRWQQQEMQCTPQQGAKAGRTAQLYRPSRALCIQSALSGLGDGLLPSVNPLQKCPHRPAQKQVSVLLPDTVNLATQITCRHGTTSPT